ncbi:hypothetical protein [Brucella pseudogrignonensis]|uniref:Uncharacterized protein n=1 Tax=Brucella pseudogrignonensis TaxID=419475 RepID=A0ABU1MF45_9HYPH|nr:hypothetical protein [Brucella pseudogrignonensis]MDR6434621.1 hypothetical protein [Brucella pseudogrignonensis]
MENMWLTKLNYHASTVQNASETILEILNQEDLDEQRAQMALKIVREGHSAFQAFSHEIRDADLNSSFYSAASEVDDAWSNLVQILLEKLLKLQTLHTCILE